MTKYNSEKNDNNELPSISSASEQALEWFTRLEETPVKASVQLEFLNWCAENPENKQAYEQIAQLWGSEVFVQALQIEEQRISHKKSAKTRRFRPGLAIAATLLLGVWGIFQGNMLQRLTADLYTTVGQQQTLILADGSSVMLDTDSAIKVSYDEHGRNVDLLSGRAFFNIQPDITRPFIVKTEEESIRVVGTRFIVNTESNTPLIVQHGIVAYRANNADNTDIVIAGEQLEKTQNQFKVIETDQSSAVFSWTEGRFKFHNLPLGEIIAEIDRYQPGIIILGNQKLSDIGVTGDYKLNNPRAIIASLAQATGAKVVNVSEYLTVLY